MKKSYLVAFDGSRWSQEALQKATEWAKANDASLTVLSVIEPVSSYAGLIGEAGVDWTGSPVGEHATEIQKHFKDAGQDILNQAEELLKDSGVTYIIVYA